MDVRKRLFDNWVSQGRMSWVDAHDRLERQCSALKHMIAYKKLVEQEQPQDFNPTVTEHAEASVNSLDHADDVGVA
jgi:hypothetical protein